MDSKSGVLMKRYELGRLLGQGAFAKVYYARSFQTGQSVAIKVIDKEKVMRVGNAAQIIREISIMRLVRHPNIIYLYEVMATKTKIYFVMEYAKGGELFNKVAKGKLPEDVARKYFQQLISAVDFCHSRAVYHRDLKPENILLDEDENLKVSDFGLSAVAESRRQDGLLHTTCGTPAYVSPEVINRKGYDGAKADVWSCGVILYVLLAGYLPFYDSNLMEMYRKIGKAKFRFPSWFQPEVRKLLTRILDPNPESRITIARIKENAWFKRGLFMKSKTLNAESSTINSLDRAAAAESGGALEGIPRLTNLSARGLGMKSRTLNAKSSTINSLDRAAAAESGGALEGTPRLTNLSAFHIISLSDGFDVSRLFEDPCPKVLFFSLKPASVIVSRLEEIAKRSKLKICKKDEGLFRFEATKVGSKGILSIEAEIFGVAPAFHMVEVRKITGDTTEYENLLDEVIKPGMQDVV